MPRAHLRYFFFTLAVAAVAAAFTARAVVHGQDAGAFRSFLPASILPAIDRGLAADWSHAPGTPQAIDRESMRHSIVTLDRVGSSGTRYIAGRVIVKFRDGMSASSSMAARVRAMSTVSQTATVSERPSYANFDVVGIDPGEDPEAVAAALRQRPDVEYAQPAYRMRTDFVPNDQYYKELQWNMPLIDLERAWDIQPAAGSTITVAVLDTGVSYANATVQFHASAFRNDNGVPVPAARRPHAQLRARARAGACQPVRGPARFHLERHRAARSRRPRHARQRHHRTADQQQRRHGRRGLQREDHAGQGHRRHVGRHLRLAEPGHRRHRGPGHPVRGRQRRQRHQHEHRAARRSRAGRSKTR